MRRILFILLCVLFYTACHSDDKLTQQCPLKCWPEGVDKKAMKGQCRYGKPVCDDEGNVLKCKGYVTPSTEICDGLDNDCDGEVDENLSKVRNRAFSTIHKESSVENPCPSLLGVCRKAVVSCVSGVPFCTTPSDYEEIETLCDGLDNDCDGRIDEDLFAGEFCFDDEFWKATNPPCHPGTKSCMDGTVVCTNQRLPSEEICDDLDNDCNGFVNDFDKDDMTYDFVFNIDFSGSMANEIKAVRTALFEFSALFKDDPRYRFAIIRLSSERYTTSLYSDFVNYEEFYNILTNLQTEQSGLEWALDAIYKTCDVGSNPYELSWRTDSSKYVFTFTDEELRSYDDQVTRPMIVNMCNNHRVKPYSWVLPQFVNDSELITDNTSTETYYLSETWTVMFEQLSDLFAEICFDE